VRVDIVPAVIPDWARYLGKALLTNGVRRHGRKISRDAHCYDLGNWWFNYPERAASAGNTAFAATVCGAGSNCRTSLGSSIVDGGGGRERITVEVYRERCATPRMTFGLAAEQPAVSLGH
jgi:hypothetical protein